MGAVEAITSAYSAFKAGDKIQNNKGDVCKDTVGLFSFLGNTKKVADNLKVPETGFEAVKDSGLFQKLNGVSSACAKGTNVLMVANSVINVAEADAKDRTKVAVKEAAGIAGAAAGEKIFKSTLLKSIEKSSLPAIVKVPLTALGMIASATLGSVGAKKASEAV